MTSSPIHLSHPLTLYLPCSEKQEAIMKYGVGVAGLYVVAPGPDPKSVLSLMREFTRKVQDAVG